MRFVFQRAERPQIFVGADPCVRPDLGAHMGAPLRAESPIGNSVGRSPTLWGTHKYQALKGRNQIRIAPLVPTPLQGLKMGASCNVGLRPTLLPVGLSALLPTPLQGLMIALASYVGLCPTLLPVGLSALYASQIL